MQGVMAALKGSTKDGTHSTGNSGAAPEEAAPMR
ncbi:hypothetical protein QFZ74_003953 [Streptomyces sp. V3I7]|nr:hypothetical protein [Streptomyces sp. V3I7]